MLNLFQDTGTPNRDLDQLNCHQLYDDCHLQPLARKYQMFGRFRKEDPNLKRNREAQQLREMHQVWKKNLEPDAEPLRPLRKRAPRVLLFRNGNCSDVRGGFF